MEDELRLAAENILSEFNKARQTVGKTSMQLNWGTGNYTAAKLTAFEPFFDIRGPFLDAQWLSDNVDWEKDNIRRYYQAEDAEGKSIYAADYDGGEKISGNGKRESFTEAAAIDALGGAVKNVAVSSLLDRESVAGLAKAVSLTAINGAARFDFGKDYASGDFIAAKNAGEYEGFSDEGIASERYIVPESRTEVIKEVFGHEHSSAESKASAIYRQQRNLEQPDIALIGMALAKELHEQLIAGYPMYVR